MIRILGVDLPVNKPVYIGLQAIRGIGPALSRQVCDDLKIVDKMRVSEMSPDLVAQISEYIAEKGKESSDCKWKVGGALKQIVSADISRLQRIGCRRGVRHRNRLPVHGQRTKSNSRNAKGKAGATAITRKSTK